MRCLRNMWLITCAKVLTTWTWAESSRTSSDPLPKSDVCLYHVGQMPWACLAPMQYKHSSYNLCDFEDRVIRSWLDPLGSPTLVGSCTYLARLFWITSTLITWILSCFLELIFAHVNVQCQTLLCTLWLFCSVSNIMTIAALTVGLAIRLCAWRNSQL